MGDPPPYQTDAGAIVRFTVATTLAGSAIGGVVGMARSVPAGRMAFSVGLQCLAFSTSFCVIREAYRKVTRVKSWRDGWYEINTVSAGTGAAIAALVRTAGDPHRPRNVVISSCVMGLVLGFGCSLAYRALDTWRIRKGQQLSEELRGQQRQQLPEPPRQDAPQEHVRDTGSTTTGDAGLFGWRNWAPIRPISKEEAEEKRRLAREQN